MSKKMMSDKEVFNLCNSQAGTGYLEYPCGQNEYVIWDG